MIPMEIYKIRGSSNLFVDKMHSIVALRKSAFFSLSNNVLPKKVWLILVIWNRFEIQGAQESVSFIIKYRIVEKKMWSKFDI